MPSNHLGKSVVTMGYPTGPDRLALLPEKEAVGLSCVAHVVEVV